MDAVAFRRDIQASTDGPASHGNKSEAERFCALGFRLYVGGIHLSGFSPKRHAPVVRAFPGTAVQYAPGVTLIPWAP